MSLADNTKARLLGPDGVYRRTQPINGQPARRSQTEFITLAAGKPARAKGKEKYPRMELAPAPASRWKARP